ARRAASPPSGWSPSTRATSWTTRRCSWRCPTLPASASPRRTSRSVWVWYRRSGRYRTTRPARGGDGGLLVSTAEMTTVDRLGLPLVIVVYNDATYGAEVHHFGPDADLSTVCSRCRTWPRSRSGSVARASPYARWMTCDGSATGWPARATGAGHRRE